MSPANRAANFEILNPTMEPCHLNTANGLAVKTTASGQIPGEQRNLFNAMRFSANLTAQESLVRIAYSWSSSRYTIYAEADVESIQHLQEEISNYYDKASPGYTPIINEVVVFKSSVAGFVRARVIDVKETTVDLVYIDWGGSMRCSSSEILPMIPAIYKYPVYGMIIKLRLYMSSTEIERSQADISDVIFQEAFWIHNGLPLHQPQHAEPVVRLWYKDKSKGTINTSIQRMAIENRNSLPVYNTSEWKETYYSHDRFLEFERDKIVNSLRKNRVGS